MAALRQARTPDGFVVFADAVCSFNPTYGQGMTVAAIEAKVLSDCLRHGDENLPQRFFRASAKKIQTPWRTAVGSDLKLPQVPGHRSLATRITNAYMDLVLTATETDPTVAQQFFRVVWMLDEPGRLFRPAIVVRIVKALITGARNCEQAEHQKQMRSHLS
jgi:2-polyprenyl-6-methoxyphenol hydroxylase-like FAD-dependent oxidoreductase